MVALVALAYGNALHGALVRDAGSLIGADTRLRALDWPNLRAIFTENAWWPSFASPLYRPLTTLSYLFNAQVLGNGLRPEGYHLINILLHALNAVLLLLLARKLFGETARGHALAFLAAALFAVHPVATESVTYLVGRADELAAAAILAGLLWHIRRRTLGVLLAALIGAFSKETGVLLIAVLALYDLLFMWPGLVGTAKERARALMRTAGLDYAAALGPTILFAVARYFAAVRGSTFLGWPYVDNPLVDAGLGTRVLTAMKVLGRLLALELFPRTLSTDYSFNQIPLYGAGGWQDIQCWLALAVILGLLALAWIVRRRAPVLAFAIAFYFGMQLPTSNLLFPIGSIMAERFLYLPSVGFCLAAAFGMGALLQARPRVVAIASAGAALVLIALLVRTRARNLDWEDELSLWRSAVAVVPQSFRAHTALAHAEWASGATEANADAAIAEAERGLAILDAHPMPLAHLDRVPELELATYLRAKGEFLRARGDDETAQAFFEKALKHVEQAQKIDDWQRSRWRALAISGTPGDDRAQLARFETEFDLQRWPEAEQAALTARREVPLAPEPHLALARLHLAQGELDDAAVEALQAVMLDSSNPLAWQLLRTVMSALGGDSGIRSSGGGYALDPSQPVMRAHLDQACAALVASFVDAKDLRGARLIYARAVDPQGFGCTRQQLGPSP